MPNTKTTAADITDSNASRKALYAAMEADMRAAMEADQDSELEAIEARYRALIESL